jgi:uncharacterized protein YunC (DUF1805 family)
MSITRLSHRQQVLDTAAGPVLGTSFRWPGGQYCAIHTERGIIGCGLYDIAVANRFSMAIAIARGTPQHPLFEPEDLLTARIADVSDAAAELGIRPGQTGEEALKLLLHESMQRLK